MSFGKINLLILMIVSLNQMACMRSGQTVRWMNPQNSGQETVWVACQNLQEQDQVLAVGGEGENVQCQVLPSEVSPRSE